MWKKKGLIFDPQLQKSEVALHAQYPTTLLLPDCLRIYFTTKDTDSRAFPAYADVERGNPSCIIDICKKPVLSLGKVGAFDDDGIEPFSVVEHNNALYLYYVGVNRAVTVDYRNFIGLAISYDGGVKFERVYDGPIIGRSEVNPFFAGSPKVLKEGENWHMWYTSGIGWPVIDGKPQLHCVIRHATSENGIDWQCEQNVCIPLNSDSEICERPSVIKKDGNFNMWFCYRDIRPDAADEGNFRIGYAYSNDAVRWWRDDSKVGFLPEESLWDSNMQCFPDVTIIDDRTHMFYNGNNFGQSGIGFAVYEEQYEKHKSSELEEAGADI